MVLPPLIVEVEGKCFTHPLGDVGGKLRLKFVHETFRRFPVENKSRKVVRESKNPRRKKIKIEYLLRKKAGAVYVIFLKFSKIKTKKAKSFINIWMKHIENLSYEISKSYKKLPNLIL